MKKISLFFLIAISVSAIVNLRGLGFMASGGLTTLGLSLLAVLLFFIPSTYVSTQLAIHTAKKGGVYEWVHQAFGQQWGFVAIWMEWVNNLVGFPATLASIVGMLSLFLFHDLPSPAMFAISMLVLLWLALWYNHGALRITSWLNVLGTIGTLIVVVLMLTLGCLWAMENQGWNQLSFSAGSLSWSDVAVFVSFIGAYSGIQIAGFHVEDIANPKKSFAIALPVSALIVVVMLLGTSAIIAMLIPPDQLNVMVSVEQLIQLLFAHFQLPNVGFVMTLFVILAMLASFSAWLMGPARGMQAALESLGIKHYFARVNRYHSPTGMLCLQGIITSGLILSFLCLPSIKAGFWVMVAITSQFTALMYVLIFAAGFKLIARRWYAKLLCALGILSCLIGFCVGLIAPSQLGLVSPLIYTTMVLIGDVIIITGAILFARRTLVRR